ncbi:MAG: PDZ domain-containing protein [Acidobacteriota bacterium]
MHRLILLILLALSVVSPAPLAQGLAHGLRRPATEVHPAWPEQGESTTAVTPPAALVYVMQTIDLSQQLGSEENLLTLDGEPLPPMLTRNITLGLVLDNSGHIVTRLIGIGPKNPPQSVVVTPQSGRPTKARFIGLDAATGLSVLEVAGEGFAPPTAVSKETAQTTRPVHLFGFNAAQAQTQSPSMGFARPRIHALAGRVARAVGDFRYQVSQPLFRLLSPRLTAIQDGSVVVDSEGALFGVAISDTTDEGQNLVYSMARINGIATAVIQSQDSLAHGWLGATGVTMFAPIANPLRNASPDLGVRVTGVLPDSPAEKAGIQTQDVLVAINDRSIASVEQLSTALRKLSPHSDVSLRLRRGGEYKVLHAKLIPAPSDEKGQQPAALARQLRGLEDQLRSLEANDPQRRVIEPKVTAMRSIMDNILRPAPPEVKLRVRYGIDVEPLTTQLMRYFAVSSGLLVTAVTETDRAARAGLRAGDVIVAIGKVPVNDVVSLLKGLDETGEQPIVLAVSRQREHVQLTLARDLP